MRPLTESKAELEQQYLAVLEARRVKDEFLTKRDPRTPNALDRGDGLHLAPAGGVLGSTHRPSAQRSVVWARDASDRLLALIDNLLEMTTLKRGGMDVQVETFDPRDLLREAATATKGRPDSTELRIEVPPDPVRYMRSDRRKLAKVLSSLISNAYKFTARGVVTASLEVASGRALYRVQDTGIGVR